MVAFQPFLSNTEDPLHRRTRTVGVDVRVRVGIQHLLDRVIVLEITVTGGFEFGKFTIAPQLRVLQSYEPGPLDLRALDLGQLPSDPVPQQCPPQRVRESLVEDGPRHFSSVVVKGTEGLRYDRVFVRSSAPVETAAMTYAARAGRRFVRVVQPLQPLP